MNRAVFFKALAAAALIPAVARKLLRKQTPLVNEPAGMIQVAPMYLDCTFKAKLSQFNDFPVALKQHIIVDECNNEFVFFHFDKQTEGAAMWGYPRQYLHTIPRDHHA